MREIVEKLKEEITFDELEEMLRDCIGYDGYFEDLDYWENDEEFFETFYQGRLNELVRALSYGNYNYMDEYVHINAYGNIDSANKYDYQAEIEGYEDEIIEHYLELYEENNVYPSQDLKNKIDECIEEEEENDEIN